MRTTTLLPTGTNEYRCTRDLPYAVGSMGWRDTTSRQGHYIEARSENEARKQMEEKFPSDVRRGYGFTVTLFKKGNR